MTSTPPFLAPHTHIVDIVTYDVDMPALEYSDDEHYDIGEFDG